MRGFTLIELVVVIGVIALLTSILIIGLGGSRVKFNLMVERAHIVEAITRAKSLAIQTFLENPDPTEPQTCGYGVRFDYVGDGVNYFGDNTYFIYRDVEVIDPDTGNPDQCKGSHFRNDKDDFTPEDGDAMVQLFALPSRYVTFFFDNQGIGNNVPLKGIVFFPPDPNVRFITDVLINERKDEGFILLQTVEPKPEILAICVSQEGAVSYKDCPPVF